MALNRRKYNFISFENTENETFLFNNNFMENINKQTIFGVIIDKNFQKPYISIV